MTFAPIRCADTKALSALCMCVFDNSHRHGWRGVPLRVPLLSPRPLHRQPSFPFPPLPHVVSPLPTPCTFGVTGPAAFGRAVPHTLGSIGTPTPELLPGVCRRLVSPRSSSASIMSPHSPLLSFPSNLP
eukprot:GGOE01002740.1.p3 GENE.GGOE01002740.1~~GGOE01002740.1.p3  ORF type:complete len:129 (-),score=2.22 GGOE01002740.1:66-452(-)